MTVNYNERACLFGSTASLIGVLTLPAGPRCEDDLAVVVLNTGTTHRVGHNRMYVSLARAIAASGYPVFRFDFSGVGDSQPSRNGGPLLESNLGDIRAALDWMETSLRARRIILVGLCSGADHAVMYSHTDERIAGLVLLDPYVSKTLRYVLDYALARIADPRGVLQFRPGKSFLIRAILYSLLGSYRPSEELHHISFHGNNPRRTLEDIYRKNIAAGVQILAVCTGMDFPPKHTYEIQFRDSFRNVDFRDQLHLHFLTRCDHLFSSPRGRDALNELVVPWIANTQFREVSPRDAMKR
jgi:pimeloyl-ACP methyl ester carboxylesterase